MRRASLKKLISILIFIVVVLTFLKFYDKTALARSHREINSKQTDNSLVTDETLPIEIDWHNYTQIKEDAARQGPGEQGTGVRIPKSESEMEQKIYRVNGFNGYASDKISIQRSLRDIRHPDCKNKTYHRILPSVSVIIPFHQEHWSTLIRSVDSVTRRAPKGIIKEVLLVDDASTKDFLQKPLELYLSNHYPIARVIRTKGRQGLIRTRVLGAKHATGDVLIFLDSHVEANTNWLPPLLDPIAQNYKVVTCPLIDVLNMDTFEYSPQDEGARGIFNWRMNYKRLPRLKSDMSHPSDPFDSPVMAGGLFAISRRWFWELGGYDKGLDIWGGEQYELSFKLWQCGGRMVDVPCSRIGHVYRKFAPFPNNAKGNFVRRNFKRVALVWMDEYIKYLYLRDPAMKDEDPRDLTEQYQIREKLKCRNFSWFMKEVAFDIPKFYPLMDPPSAARGQIQLIQDSTDIQKETEHKKNKKGLCFDFQNEKNGEPVLLKECRKGYYEQDIDFSSTGEIRPHNTDSCMDCADYQVNGAVLIFHCHAMRGNQFFKYDMKHQHIWKIGSNIKLCVHGNAVTKQLTLQNCDDKTPHIINGLKWKLNNINSTALNELFNSHGLVE